MNADAAAYLPHRSTMRNLPEAILTCQGCELYKSATQSVFGCGHVAKRPPLMVVGEAPGDKEDLAGKPFVGPAGALLDRAFHDAGIMRREVYLTNAVKHFKWNPRAKRRLHAKPIAREVSACHPWLQAEYALLRPQRIICLGAAAGQSLPGPQFRIARDRGRIIESATWGIVVASWHPAAILRAPSADQRERMYQDLVADFRTALGTSS